MKRVAIITDSTACIPPELAATYDIQVIPLFLEFEDAVYEDGLEGSAESFYQTLRDAKRPPTTAAPAPGVYAEAMLEAGRHSSAVLVDRVFEFKEKRYHLDTIGCRQLQRNTGSAIRNNGDALHDVCIPKLHQ